ncbi:hypothetical protein Rin_00004490 [Candidatus Regiella insecticola 5.15]|uniref:Uncharacterized protein n=2 Tax=Candidatus Regiella insecticola TaxID=138073 RepID=G2GXF7_9ENTR|nr:hypothetical protein Rin_00004490 [Candidatus Regiella insecticola 5.15]
MIHLSSEQRHMIKLIDDHATKFPLSDVGDEQLLSSGYDFMPAFKRIIDSTSKLQMDYICQQYEGFYRFAKLMERVAQCLADGVIEVPKYPSNKNVPPPFKYLTITHNYVGAKFHLSTRSRHELLS